MGKMIVVTIENNEKNWLMKAYEKRLTVVLDFTATFLVSFFEVSV